MKLTIDREADALYLDLDSTPAAESEEIAPGVIFDYNADGKVVGIEIYLHLPRIAASVLARARASFFDMPFCSS